MLITPITAVRSRQAGGQFTELSDVVVGNARETIGLKRCTTHQNAINITHPHEFIDVAFLH